MRFDQVGETLPEHRQFTLIVLAFQLANAEANQVEQVGCREVLIAGHPGPKMSLDSGDLDQVNGTRSPIFWVVPDPI